MALPWIYSKLGWKDGDGAHIKLGIDPIVDLKMNYVLSNELCDYLHDCGIINICQAHNIGYPHTSPSYWMSAEDLELGGSCKEEWYCYV